MFFVLIKHCMRLNEHDDDRFDEQNNTGAVLHEYNFDCCAFWCFVMNDILAGACNERANKRKCEQHNKWA